MVMPKFVHTTIREHWECPDCFCVNIVHHMGDGPSLAACRDLTCRLCGETFKNRRHYRYVYENGKQVLRELSGRRRAKRTPHRQRPASRPLHGDAMTYHARIVWHGRGRREYLHLDSSKLFWVILLYVKHDNAQIWAENNNSCWIIAK